MSVPDLLQSVQFVSTKGRRLAVLSADDWKALVEWIETLEDAAVARRSFARLKAAGSRKKAGWVEWKKAAREIE